MVGTVSAYKALGFFKLAYIIGENQRWFNTVLHVDTFRANLYRHAKEQAIYGVRVTG